MIFLHVVRIRIHFRCIDRFTFSFASFVYIGDESAWGCREKYHLSLHRNLVVKMKLVQQRLPNRSTGHCLSWTRKIAQQTHIWFLVFSYHSSLYPKIIIERHLIKNSKGLKIPDCNTEQSKHSFFVETIVHWNQLPDKVLCADSVEAFKTALQEYSP